MAFLFSLFLFEWCVNFEGTAAVFLHNDRILHLHGYAVVSHAGRAFGGEF
ncbi:hypothetical protein GS8_891 [Geobacillus stearothermophilus]|uniref:Uncharacterized protein n=1 Tax=Geobacillus stearothermophilus TaxID=1422 RepID=A0ABQ7HHZ9_GEOSE|nr:hypothetical protein GS8_891 [Geobacillus stearothermophilus]